MPADDLLAKYAEVTIRVGTGLEGHRLLIRSSVDAIEFTRFLVNEAYLAGASNVDVRHRPLLPGVDRRRA